MEYQIANDKQLAALLSEALANGPLYRTYIYHGKGAHHAYPSGASYAALPKHLRLYCGDSRCQETWWSTENPDVAFEREFIDG